MDKGVTLGFFLKDGRLSVYDSAAENGEIAMRDVDALDFADVGRTVVSMAALRMAQRDGREDAATLYVKTQHERLAAIGRFPCAAGVLAVCHANDASVPYYCIACHHADRVADETLGLATTRKAGA